MQDVTVKIINEVSLCFNDCPDNNTPCKATGPYIALKPIIFIFLYCHVTVVTKFLWVCPNTNQISLYIGVNLYFLVVLNTATTHITTGEQLEQFHKGAVSGCAVPRQEALNHHNPDSGKCLLNASVWDCPELARKSPSLFFFPPSGRPGIGTLFQKCSMPASKARGPQS